MARFLLRKTGSSRSGSQAKPFSGLRPGLLWGPVWVTREGKVCSSVLVWERRGEEGRGVFLTPRPAGGRPRRAPLTFTALSRAPSTPGRNRLPRARRSSAPPRPRAFARSVRTPTAHSWSSVFSGNPTSALDPGKFGATEQRPPDRSMPQTYWAFPSALLPGRHRPRRSRPPDEALDTVPGHQDVSLREAPAGSERSQPPHRQQNTKN